MSALVALTVLLVVELLRAFPALVAWRLGTASEVSSTATAVTLIAPVVGAAGLVILATRRDPRWALVGGGVTLGVARFGVQVVDGEPAVLLAGVGLLGGLAALGTLALIGLPLFGGGVVAGVLLDAALHATMGTRNLVWIDHGWTVAVVGTIVAWYLWLVLARARRDVIVLGRSLAASLPLMVIGLVLVVEAFMLANLGWVSQALGTGWLGASVAVGVAGAAGVVAAGLTARFPTSCAVQLAAVGAVALVGLAWAGYSPGLWWVPALILAQMSIGSGLTTISVRGVGSGGTSMPTVAVAVGYVALLAVIVTLDGRGVLGTNLAPTTATAATGLLLAVSVLTAASFLAPAPHRPGRAELPSLAGVFVIPAIVLLAGTPFLAQGSHLTARIGTGELRVVTYNVQLAFDVNGRLNLDSVAATLAELDADVIALQEVPRGHLPTGGVDMLGWLQRSLGMEHATFQSSSPGSMHGNAVLSRYPIGSVEAHRFNRSGTSLPRGAVAATIQLPWAGDVVVISAHLPPGGSPRERAERVDALLRLWGSRDRTVIAADMNSQPGSDIMRGILDAGLRSAWIDTDGPGFTFPSDAPRARIDWVLHSPDMEAIETVVYSSTASDHLPLLAVLRVPEG